MDAHENKKNVINSLIERGKITGKLSTQEIDDYLIECDFDVDDLEEIEHVLSKLTPREARVLKLRFGLEDGHLRTLEEVGNVLNVTRERVRQIEVKALRKLHNPTRIKRLKDFV